MAITVVVRKPLPTQDGNGNAITESQLEQNLLSGFGDVLDYVGDETVHQIDLIYKTIAQRYEWALKHKEDARYNEKYAFITKENGVYTCLAPLELADNEKNSYSPVLDKTFKGLFNLDEKSYLVMYLVSPDKIIRKEITEAREIKPNDKTVLSFILSALEIEKVLKELNLLGKKEKGDE